jgi:hypothetical protein
MSNVQEIIVYRNPLEREMWHALEGGDTGIIIFSVIVAAIVGIFVLWLLTEKTKGFLNRYAGLFGIAASLLVAYYMLHKVSIL